MSNVNDCIKNVCLQWEARAEKAEAELTTLKKDARLLAEYIKPLWHEKHNTPNQLKEAVYRVLEATKEDE